MSICLILRWIWLDEPAFDTHLLGSLERKQDAKINSPFLFVDRSVELNEARTDISAKGFEKVIAWWASVTHVL